MGPSRVTTGATARATTGAILLAGGRARRLDGAAKHLFDIAGRTLFERAVSAVADATPVTVVGDRIDGFEGVDDLRWVREHPHHTGPAAAIVAALSTWPGAATALSEDPATACATASATTSVSGVDPEWTYVLACDLPGVEAAAARLAAARPLLPDDTDGVCLADPTSRPQWLTGLYRTTALRRGADALADAGRDAAVRDIVADLAVAVIGAPAAETTDIDTWEDLQRARARLEEEK